MGNQINILVVEDSPVQAMKLKNDLHKNSYHVTVAGSGEEALTYLCNNKPNVIISDIVMPGIDGYQLCRQIKSDEKLKHIPVILLTQLSDPKDVIRGLKCGANNFLTKPYNEIFLISRIKSVLNNCGNGGNGDEETSTSEIFFAGERHYLTLGNRQILDFLLSTYENAVQKNLDLIKTQDELKKLNKNLEIIIRERTNSLEIEVKERKMIEEDLKISLQKLKRTIEGTVNAIASMVEMRDPYTAGHERRVAKLATAIAAEMKLSKEQKEGVRMAGFLHDIGKIVVPAEILSKPGSLNENEFGIIKNHPQLGYEIIKDVEFPAAVAQAILQHHERLDGSGYPRGLMGEEIILEAKIISVADVVEAISSHRPYRPAWGIDKAIGEIVEKKAILYDSQVVDACVKLFGEKNYQL